MGREAPSRRASRTLAKRHGPARGRLLKSSVDDRFEQNCRPRGRAMNLWWRGELHDLSGARSPAAAAEDSTSRPGRGGDETHRTSNLPPGPSPSRARDQFEEEDARADRRRRGRVLRSTRRRAATTRSRTTEIAKVRKAGGCSTRRARPTTCVSWALLSPRNVDPHKPQTRSHHRLRLFSRRRLFRAACSAFRRRNAAARARRFPKGAASRVGDARRRRRRRDAAAAFLR